MQNLGREGFATQEKMAKLSTSDKSIHIGIPKTSTYSEKRIPLTPESVELLSARGHRVWIEAGAGLASQHTDNDYSEAGAKIVYDHKEVYSADVILKMSPITMDEVEFLSKGKKIFSPLHLPQLKAPVIQELLNKQVVSIAYEYIKDEVKNFPIVHALSEIAGRAAVLIGGELLSNEEAGQGVMLGGISGVKPTKVVILGAGTVGESAARAALGFGAEVKVFDNNIYKLRRLQNNLGTRLYTSTINPTLLGQALHTADIAIGAIHSKTGRTPVLVTEGMVQQMPEKSIVIDISIDQGGVFETSEVTSLDKPTFVKHDVIHYCVPNIASAFAKTASQAMSNILTPIIINAGDSGGFDSVLRMNKGMRKGVYTFKGKLTNLHLSERFQIKYTDLELLMATGFGS